MTEVKTKDELLASQTDYVKVFGGAVGKRVLNDLMKFCRVGEVPLGPDDRTSWILQGRNEVAIRILQRLKLSQDELYALWAMKGRTPND